MIPSGIMEALFTAGLFAMGWMIKYGFTIINTTLKEINVNLSNTINRLVQLETWKTESEKLSKERHVENQNAISKLEEEMKRRRR